jgi:hypothetical protein
MCRFSRPKSRSGPSLLRPQGRAVVHFWHQELVQTTFGLTPQLSGGLPGSERLRPRASWPPSRSLRPRVQSDQPSSEPIRLPGRGRPAQRRPLDACEVEGSDVDPQEASGTVPDKPVPSATRAGQLDVVSSQRLPPFVVAAGQVTFREVRRRSSQAPDLSRLDWSMAVSTASRVPRSWRVMRESTSDFDFFKGPPP